MPQKSIIYAEKPVTISCDGKCNKAWGINHRPTRMLSDNPDDFVFLGDGELGIAPDDPGTYEGGCGKPSGTVLTDGNAMNKWCTRECERCVVTDAGAEIVPRDMDNPRPNMRSR